MLRVVVFLLAFLCVAVPECLAQDSVEVRASEQQGFSRLVFDWGKPASYRVDKATPGKLILHFDLPGALSATPGAMNNIDGVSVISQAPLEIAISIPAGSKTKDFQAGSRTIIDVYGEGKKNPVVAAKSPAPVKKEEPKQVAKAPEKKVVSKAEPKVESKAETKPEPKTEEKVAEHKPAPSTPVAVHNASPAAKAAVEAVIGEDLVPPQADEQKKPEPEKAAASNLITLSSIEATGMAVFQRGGGLWMVTDLDNILLAPQISGPDAKFFLPVENFNIDGGKIFRVRAMDGASIKAQGGGLLWRLTVPGTPNKVPPVLPERLTEKNPNPPRGAMIVWPFGEARRVFKITDPETGREMYVITTASAKKYGGPAMKFVDFETLDSAAGLVILPKVDDLEVAITNEGNVGVTRPGGLALTGQEEIASLQAAHSKQVNPGKQANAKRIFDLKNWQMGGIEAMDENRNIVMGSIGDKEGNARVEGLLTLAKMYLSNGMWAEAKGVLNLAEDELPELNQNPSFIAMTGAAQALGWESEEAFEKLSSPELVSFPEISYWRAFSLADLGDWQQADEVFTDELFILSDYPSVIRSKLSLALAEVALRAGDTNKGEKLLEFVEDNKPDLKPQQLAALTYLKGEAERQKKNTDETEKLWKSLASGPDPLYRAKAGLALTRLMEDKKKLTSEKAIDNLERLRYAWRGDELEAQIAYWLGRSYFEKADYVKGLVIMHDAASYAEGTDIGRRITSEMTDVFVRLFLSPNLDKISALDAAGLYEKFLENVAEQNKADLITDRLAERLVKADLLGKASELLRSLAGRRTGDDAYALMTRLAAIALLDSKPAEALTALDSAKGIFAALPEETKTPERALELSLLRARALSKQDRFEQALSLLKDLPRNPSVSSLRADIAWNAGYWDEAALALDEVILDRDISTTRPADAESAAIILQRAVALNLGGDRVGLANLREKYNSVMAQSDKARVFEVVTRPRQSAALADRQTLMGIVSEVDLFKDFLDGYKNTPKPEKAANAAPAASQ